MLSPSFISFLTCFSKKGWFFYSVLLHFSGHLVHGAGLCEALHELAFEMLLRIDFYMGENAHTKHKLDA